MKAFRLQHPVLFSLGTAGAIVVSGLVMPVFVLLTRLVPYPATAGNIAYLDLILPPLKSTLLAWFPWVVLSVGLSGALVILISALCGGLSGVVRVTLILIALSLIAINLLWAWSVLLSG